MAVETQVDTHHHLAVRTTSPPAWLSPRQWPGTLPFCIIIFLRFGVRPVVDWVLWCTNLLLIYSLNIRCMNSLWSRLIRRILEVIKLIDKFNVHQPKWGGVFNWLIWRVSSFSMLLSNWFDVKLNVDIHSHSVECNLWQKAIHLYLWWDSTYIAMKWKI